MKVFPLYIIAVFLILFLSYSLALYSRTLPEYLYPISKNCEEGRRYGFINKKGEVVIQPGYVKAFPFSEGSALVQGTYRAVKKIECDPLLKESVMLEDITGLYHYTHIDGNNRPLYTESWGMARSYRNGMALVAQKRDGAPAFIDRDGNKVVKGNYSRAQNFSEDLAPVQLASEKGPHQALWGYVNKKGQLQVPAAYDAVTAFHNGYAGVTKDGSALVIDRKGSIVSEYPGHVIEGFYDGLGLIYDSNSKLWGYIDERGFVIAPQFSEASHFSEGYAAVCAGWGAVKRCGYINKKGFFAIPPYSKRLPGDFHEGRAIFFDRRGGCGYIDRSGSIKINAIYSSCNPFQHGLARVKIEMKGFGSREAYINMKGEVLWEEKSLLEQWILCPPGKKNYQKFKHFANSQKKINPGDINLTLLKECLLFETNRLRRLHKRRSLKYSIILTSIATGHSLDMMRLRFFSHESPEPMRKTLTRRFQRIGLWKGRHAENIARVKLFSEKSIEAVASDTYMGMARFILLEWMQTPGMRKNLLRKDMKSLGIGIAVKKNTLYCTQTFSSINAR